MGTVHRGTVQEGTAHRGTAQEGTVQEGTQLLRIPAQAFSCMIKARRLGTWLHLQS